MLIEQPPHRPALPSLAHGTALNRHLNALLHGIDGVLETAVRTAVAHGGNLGKGGLGRPLHDMVVVDRVVVDERVVGFGIDELPGIVLLGLGLVVGFGFSRRRFC